MKSTYCRGRPLTTRCTAAFVRIVWPKVLQQTGGNSLKEGKGEILRLLHCNSIWGTYLQVNSTDIDRALLSMSNTDWLRCSILQRLLRELRRAVQLPDNLLLLSKHHTGEILAPSWPTRQLKVEQSIIYNIKVI